MSFVPEDRILLLFAADKNGEFVEAVSFVERSMTDLRLTCNAAILHKIHKRELGILEKQFSALKWYDDFSGHYGIPKSEAVYNDIKLCLENKTIYTRPDKSIWCERYELLFEGERRLRKMKEMAGDYFDLIEKRITKCNKMDEMGFLLSVEKTFPEFEKKKTEYGFPKKKTCLLQRLK